MDGLGSVMYERDHLVKLVAAIGPRRARSDRARITANLRNR